MDEIVLPRKVADRDSKYMGFAWFVASMSKDPSTQVGAFIYNPKTNRPQGWGYNGPPELIPDDSFSWSRPEKYYNVNHAEENAIEHSPKNIKGCTIYVTHMPCYKCMLKIVTKKIKRVVYTDLSPDAGSMTKNTEELKQSLWLAKRAGISFEKFSGDLSWMPTWMDRIKELGVFD